MERWVMWPSAPYFFVPSVSNKWWPSDYDGDAVLVIDQRRRGPLQSSRVFQTDRCTFQMQEPKTLR